MFVGLQCSASTSEDVQPPMLPPNLCGVTAESGAFPIAPAWSGLGPDVSIIIPAMHLAWYLHGSAAAPGAV